jgi:septal ring factor EnvC (AmiA/AmiB activator)
MTNGITQATMLSQRGRMVSFDMAVSAILLSIALAAAPAAASGRERPLDRGARLENMRLEMERLESELDRLRERERGVLGELERMGAELRLHEAKLREVDLRIEQVTATIDSRSLRLQELEGAQRQRRAYLTFRLREIYKEGPEQLLKRVVGGGEIEDYWAALRFAYFLSDRDARVIGEYEAAAAEVAEQRRRLLAERQELALLRDELSSVRRRMSAARRQRARLLEEIRGDKTKRQAAVEELQSAAGELSDLVDSLELEAGRPALDMHKFKGLLDWPAEGALSAKFGSVVHPRFKTSVPHPGLDIDGRAGSDIRNIFDGRVVFSSWMRGYGLTAIVDHGGGCLSVYAHASVLLVEVGEQVMRGQSLGKIGDTGSLRGPFLYFEMRVDGEPTDPEQWLRPR